MICRRSVQKAKQVLISSIRWLNLSSLNSAFFTHSGTVAYFSFGAAFIFFILKNEKNRLFSQGLFFNYYSQGRGAFI